MRFLIFFLLFFTGCTASPITLTGKPVTINGISGDTTGTGIQVGKTVVETDVGMLSGEIEVTGHWETRKRWYNLKHGDYKVFIVDTISRAENE